MNYPLEQQQCVAEPHMYIYGTPPIFCYHCGMSSTRPYTHVGFGGQVACAPNYLVDPNDRTLTNVNYEYGIASPGREVKIIQRRDLGLSPCLQWDEVYRGKIIGYEWPYHGEPQQQSSTWYPLIMYYQSAE